MRFPEIFSALEEEVKARLSGAPGGGHDWDHTCRVMKNAEQLLAEEPEADRETVLFAALLHDCARPEEHASRGRVCHARKGAELAAELMKARGLPPEFCARVAEIIRTHRYRADARPTTPEGRIVFDADKLDSLGAAGLGRAFLFAGACGARLHNTEKEALEGAPYGPEDTAYREYLVKLRHLPQVMQTPAGRRLAEERLRFMAEFFRRLDEEVFDAPGPDGK